MFWDMIVTVWSLVDGSCGAAWASLVIHPELRMVIASAIPMQSVNRRFMVSPYMLIFFRRVEEVDPLASERVQCIRWYVNEPEPIPSQGKPRSPT